MAGHGNSMPAQGYGVLNTDNQEAPMSSVSLQQQILGPNGTTSQYNQNHLTTQQTHMPYHQQCPTLQQFHGLYKQRQGAQPHQLNGSLLTLNSGRLVDLKDPEIQRDLRQAHVRRLQQPAATPGQQNPSVASQTTHSRPGMTLLQSHFAQSPGPRQQAGYNPAGSLALSTSVPYAQATGSHPVQYPQHPHQQQRPYPMNTSGINIMRSAAQSQSPSNHILAHTSTPGIIRSQMFANGLTNIDGSPVQRQISRHTSTRVQPTTSSSQSDTCVPIRREGMQGHRPTSSPQHRFTGTGTNIYAPQPQRKIQVPQPVSGHRQGHPAVQIPSYSSPPRVLHDQGGRTQVTEHVLGYPSNHEYTGNSHEQPSLAPTQVLCTLSPPNSIPRASQKRKIEEVGLADAEEMALSTKRQKCGQESASKGPVINNNEAMGHKGSPKIHNARRLSPIVIDSNDHAAIVQIQDDDTTHPKQAIASSAENRPAEPRPTEAPGFTEMTSTNRKIPATPQQTLPIYESSSQKLEAQRATMAGMSADIFGLFVHTMEPDVDRWLLNNGLGGLIHRPLPPLVQRTEEYRQSFEIADALVQGLAEMRQGQLDDFPLAAEI